MTTTATPTTPAQFEDWLQTNLSTPEKAQAAVADGTLAATIAAYSSARNATMDGVRAQVAEQVQLIDDQKADLRKPPPMGSPVSRAGIEPFGGHDQQLSPIKRDWIALLLAILARENPYLRCRKPNLPPHGQLVCERPEWGEVDRSLPLPERVLDSQLREPGFPSSSRHLQHSGEPGCEKSAIHHFLLAGVEKSIHGAVE